MNRKSSFVKKVVAVGLSLLMLVGTLPLSVAAETALLPTSDTQDTASPDEQSPTQPDSSTDTEDYPKVSLNEEAVSYQEVKDKPLYISGEKFTSYTVEFKPDSSIFSSIKDDLDSDSKDNFSVTLSVNGTDSDVKGNCEFTADNGIVTVELNIASIYPDGISSGEYTFVVSYESADSSKELGKTSFKVLNESPILSIIKYEVVDSTDNVKNSFGWSKNDVSVTFWVVSEILDTVTVKDESGNDVPFNELNDGKYTFTAQETGVYTVKAVDKLEKSGEKTTDKILIDKVDPVISEPKFYKPNGDKAEGWVNEALTVELKLTDNNGSGIDPDTIKVTAGEDNVLSVDHIFTDTNGTLSFVAQERQNYTINCSDKAGRKAKEYTIDSEEIKIDMDAPKAEDFTLSFESANTFTDSVLNFLTFGLYSNDKINVTVEVNNNGLSEIKSENIFLYNGEDKIQGSGGKFVLEAPSEGSTDFDLYVQAIDEAGNDSGKIKVKEANVNTKIIKGTEETLFNFSGELYEVVISKIIPDFGKIEYNFEHKDDVKVGENEPVVHITGDGSISLNIKEEITGINNVTATIKRPNGDSVIVYSESFEKSKETEHTAVVKVEDLDFELESGEYTVTFIATSNSGNKTEISYTFVVDKNAPALGEQGFGYSVPVGDWTKNDVEVTFTLSDKTGIKTVECYKDEQEITVTDNGENYSFTAVTYGKYKVTVVDTLGNKAEFETETILIDKTAPEIKDNNFDLSNVKDGEQYWVNDAVTVKFSITDLPENANSGLTDNSLKVYVDDQALESEKVSFNKATGECSFTATQYGKYKVKLTDAVENDEICDVGTILIDKTAPEITGVSFEIAKSDNEDSTLNKKSYGTYANTSLIMTVKVVNSTNVGDGCSPLADNAVKVENIINSADDTITFVGRDGDTDNYVFNIAVTEDLTAEYIKNILMTVTDTAGNSAEFILGKDAEISVNKEGMDPKLYEIIASTATAQIDDFVVEFCKEESGVYSGTTGTISVNIKDDLIGIDTVKVEFGKIDYPDNPNNPVDIDTVKLKDVTSEIEELKNFDSSDSKVTELNFKYNADTKESGRYVFRVTAINNAGNSVPKTVDFLVDNTAPEITNIEVLGNAIKSGPNGIYINDTDNPAKLRVTVTDNSNEFPSSGISFVGITGKVCSGIDSDGKLINDTPVDWNTTDVHDNGDGTYTAEFELETNSRFTDIEVTVKDAFELETVNALVDHKLTVGKDTVEPDKKNFEIVVHHNKDYININEFEYDFDYGDKKDTKAIFKDTNNGEITIVIENYFSGIANYEITINGVAVPTDKIKVEDTTDNYDKVVKKTLTVDAKGYESGKYDIVINVTDNNKVKNSLTETFYIDKTEPVVTNIDFTARDASLLDKFFNFISFGLYSRGDIQVTVTVLDKGPSSSVDMNGIQVKSESGLRITATNEFTANESNQYGDKTYTRNFILVSNNEKSFYNDISVSVQDKFKNSNNNNEDTKVKAGDNEFKLGDIDIVASSLAPNVSEIVATGKNEYKRTSDNTLWFADNPEISFSVTDSVSKIHSVKVVLNDTDVTTSCTYNGTNTLPNEFTSFTNHSGANIDNVNVNLDTSKFNLNVNNVPNKVVVTATGNNGVEMKTSEFIFYVDKSNPYITAFDFSAGQIDGNQKPLSDNNGNPIKNVVSTTYGYYFKYETVVTVTASDGELDDTGSGVNYIGFRRVDISGKETVYEPVGVANNQASFTVPANFKGNIFAYAVDFVKNNENAEDEYTPENVIVETQAQHDANSYVNISKPSTSYKDINGKELYADNVQVTFEVASTYAGIKTVEYKVEATHDTGNNISVISEVDRNGNISDWNVVKKEANLATVLQKTITVSNNSNDIKVWVKVTDRAGFYTEKDITFSIDKVDPKIEVKYDVNEPNKILGEDFYKVDRTATVTVTERNFKAEDFTAKITNTDGTIPSLVTGTNWISYTPDPANPDSTVHIATFTFHNDGDYTFDCSFKDLVGRKAQDYGTDKFTIDQTLPKISVSYDWTNPNSYHNKQRVATITIEEHNFYANYVDIKQTATGPDNSTSATPPTVSGWSTSGDVSRATITFANDGKYSFTVDFKDKALNEAVQDRESEFYIDTKIDKLEIVDIEDMTAYDGTVAPVINYFDNNYDTSEYSLKRIDFGKEAETVTNIIPNDGLSIGFSRVVAYNDIAKIEENDGIYLLNAYIRDKAGNTDETDVLFSVNRFGSTFTILDEVTKELVNEKIYTNNAPDIVITEINVNEVSNTVIQISRDDSTQTLQTGSDYTVQESGSKTNWHAYDYTVLKKNFEDEGNYDVVVTSTDHFDNVVSNRTAYKETVNGEIKIDRTYPLSFVVDKTDPIVIISGIDSDQYYEEAVRDVTVTCDDANISSENLKIEFDGKVLSKDVDYEISETAGSVEVKLELKADGNTDDRSFKVSITDKAGNSNKDGVVERFRLSASWLARLLHYHLPLVIIICAAVAVLIGFLIFFIVKKRKKNND